MLGETEANKRINQYLRYLADPDIDYISVKVSSIHSQLHPLAFEDNLKEVIERLCQLYDVCLQQRTTDGSPKFVNLDMEAYHDLELTAEAFMRCLDEPRFREFSAGIVLQAHWTERVEAGNLYINRTTTGAIVQRQPFGGLKKSAMGAGTKAGGPNYVLQLLTLEETTPPIDGALDEDSPWLTATQG